MYQSLFGRDADPEGLAFFLAELTAGRQTINSIAINILDGAKGVDLELIDAKIAAADLFTAALDTDAEIAAYVGNDAAQVGRDFLSGVTVDNPPTIDDVNASVLTLVTNAGQEPAGPISGGGGGPVNAAPSITSDGGGDTAAVNVAENSTAVTTVAATDPEGSAVTYAVSGTDAALFTIDAGTGALSFTAAPDFENPGDANTDNVYEVTVEASDGSLKESQALSVSVTNLDAPVALNDTLKMAAPEFVVNTYTQTIQREPVIAKLANGGFVVAWESEDGQQGDTSNRAVKAGIFDASGNEVKGEFLVNEKTYSEQYQPSIAALDNGQFVIAWASTDGQQADTSGAATKARVFNADGTPATGEFIANTFYPGNQVHPAVAALGDDSFVLAWDSPPGGSIKARIFDVSDMSIETDGSVSGLGEEFLVRSASGVRSLAVTTLSSEKFIISSEPLNSDPRPVDLVDVSGMSIDAGTGAVTGVDVTEIVSNLQANGNSPSAAALANGYIVVTWTKSNSIYARVIDEAGTTKADFQVDTNTLNNQWDPSVTALSDGGFVIAWRANPNSGDYDIKARKFTIDANGALATQGT
ncbi:MAG: cadherin domain-containing protein, partial [Rhodobiaceae bacterium]|nr:cadherin domain-containing protein [Rhodobiaceae bacterium]